VVGGAVSVAGSSDFFTGPPIVLHAVTWPMSGERKKFCDATETGGVPPLMNGSPSIGTAAVSETHCDCSMIGCENASGPVNWLENGVQVGSGTGATAVKNGLRPPNASVCAGIPQGTEVSGGSPSSVA
jgi:hypothetical protein